MSFSNSGGGTLALPSPTHAHHIDVSTAVRSLRRSLSRSPSKVFSRSSSQSSDRSQHQSPQSPCRRYGSTPHRQNWSPSQPHSAPPVAPGPAHSNAVLTPLRPSLKLSLRSAKSSKSLSPSSRSLARARASPKSPLKRALSAAPDSGNNVQPSSRSSPPPTRSMGQENNGIATLGSTPHRSKEKSNRHSLHLDVSGTSQLTFLKSLGASSSDSVTVSGTGALKRSDATMNLDHPNQGSPVAKRRSLHGIAQPTSVEDLNIFGAGTTASHSFDIHDDGYTEYELTGTVLGSPQREPTPSPTPTSNLPKRSSSLRKSTLQQRYGEKGSLGRRTGERQLAQMSADILTPARNRPRLSSDHFVPPNAPRDSPFTSGSPLANVSSHLLDNKSHQPHPLSKTLISSTSGNSLTEEAPLYSHVRNTDKPKPHPFSRSLPLNASRPTARPSHEHPKVVATPNQSHQLWIGAFNSTGLISKVNRNPEEEADRKIAPPDTPCKKHSNPFATFPPPTNSMKKKSNNRNSFAGIPSTPSNSTFDRAPDTFGNTGKGLSIFQRNSVFQGSNRGSILNWDGEDRKLFGDTSDFATQVEGDVPPTPTKNTLTPSLSSLSEQSLESPSTNRTFALPLSAVKPIQQQDLKGESLGGKMIQSSEPNEDVHTPVSSAVARTQPISTSRPLSSSFSTSRAERGFQSPGPVPSQALRLHLKSSKSTLTKMSCVNSANSVEGQQTPQTPQETLLPLDTSRLSISYAPDGLAENSMPPPVTPTTARDFRSSTSIFATPVNARTTNVDVDISLYSRFDKVEQIGKGEFSTVYRVTKLDTRRASEMVTMTPSHSLSTSPTKGQVFAVKKSKHSYYGPKDREVKLREVRILQALTHAEHVVQYVDDWEHNFHLYIQTEFCEEGTLDKFLGNVGRGGRLDDFRIFKILQDLCLGLKEIHESGFMHLDMKPANILINFEGALKIGDFGLAQPCNSAEALDVEGDREYMAPEMLKGKVSQSADVFSLGLMTLEAAANVVLPDNGPTWVALRSGDLSEVPSLTWTPSIEVQRDATGNPTESVHSDEILGEAANSASNLFGSAKRSELQQPPDFMVDAFNPSSLDSIVRWMTAKEPMGRARIEQILELEGLQWVADHRNAPATVYEGSWGPAELFTVSIAVDSDTEMADV